MDHPEPYRGPDPHPEQPGGAGEHGGPGQPHPVDRSDRSRQREPQRARSRLDLEHPVIVGYDGSSSSRNALAYAAGMARRLGRSLLVVHVSSAGIYCEPLTGQVIGVPEGSSDLEGWLLAELDEVTDRSDIDVYVRTRRGSPARELAAAAAEHGADALVIGAPAHVWHHLIGSVPSWLAKHARCPVVVVP